MSDDEFMTRIKAAAATLGASMNEADLGGPSEGPDELIAKGWIYHDLPKLDTRLFELMLETFGEGEYKLLTRATYRGGTLSRGQIMLSPKARQNLTAAKDTLAAKVTEFEQNPMTPASE